MARYELPLDYIDVATRIVEFRTKHPDGSLQQVSLDFRELNGAWWVIYTAAAYRTPDDPRPGIGTAWEPVPGRTNFTKDSEVQNAETAAWGRAIVAALAADTKRGIASAEEVRNARERDTARTPGEKARADLRALCMERGLDLQQVAADFQAAHGIPITDGTAEQITAFTKTVRTGEGLSPNPPAKPRPVSELDRERNPGDPEAERKARLEEARIRREAMGVDSRGRLKPGEKHAERSRGRTPEDATWETEPAQ